MTFLKKILLVDEEPRVTALVRDALEQTGLYLIKEEHDSRHAVHAARWFQPDLILFDLITPRPASTEVARELREDPASKNIPVVFLSMNPDLGGGVVSSGILSGYSFFAKCSGIEDFVGCVAEILKSSGR
jgi:CheY-like chemotaxis protein